MTSTTREELARTLADRLEADPGDRLARLALADMLEEDGYLQAAGVQRVLAEAGCGPADDSDDDGRIDAVTAGLDEDEAERRFPGIHVTVEWCPELCAYTAQVRWETDSDEEYVIADEVGDLAAAPLRARCEWVPWWPR